MQSPAAGTADRVVASRVDPDGFREEVEFVGEGERLFSCRHLPETSPTAGVVICSPICADFMANYQREVALGRALASRGVAVQRFHYRGTGNSAGDPEAVTLDSLCEDARTIVRDFTRRLHLPTMGLVGTRWGALVAAATSRELPESPVVLWEPTLDASAYFREALRARLIRNAKTGGAAGSSPPGSFVEELEREGVVDLLGYAVYRPLYESAAGRTLASLLDQRPHAMLIVQISARKATGAAYQKLATGLTSSGHAIEVEQAEMAESWWFHTDEVVRFRPLVDRTADWLQTRLAGGIRQ